MKSLKQVFPTSGLRGGKEGDSLALWEAIFCDCLRLGSLSLSLRQRSNHPNPPEVQEKSRSWTELHLLKRSEHCIRQQGLTGICGRKHMLI